MADGSDDAAGYQVDGGCLLRRSVFVCGSDLFVADPMKLWPLRITNSVVGARMLFMLLLS